MGYQALQSFGSMVSLRRAVLDQSHYLLSKESPTDMLFKLLAENIHICPNLTSITVSQCPSSWPSFLCQLRRRNREAMLTKSTKCIEELSFYQPLHATIVMMAHRCHQDEDSQCNGAAAGSSREGLADASHQRGRAGYSGVAIYVISREWSLDARSMRLEMWIARGSEVMVRRYTRGKGTCRESVSGDCSHLIGRGLTIFMIRCVVANTCFVGRYEGGIHILNQNISKPPRAPHTVG
jgi:hypothetical protein